MAIELFAGHEIRIVYCDTRSEHEDNYRFLEDCERWFGRAIERIGSEEYRDTWDVWERTRWLVGVQGARCTAELKKRVRFAYQQPDDIQVFGFDAGENIRAERFRSNNPEIDLRTPLIDYGVRKADCIRLLREDGIEPPVIYKLGFKNANCIPCVKGQAGYWNHVRRVFPEAFDRMARLERKLDVAINKTYAGDGERKRLFLDELDPDAGRYTQEPDMECSLVCASPDEES